jgi:hypothetical protein
LPASVAAAPATVPAASDSSAAKPGDGTAPKDGIQQVGCSTCDSLPPPPYCTNECSCFDGHCRPGHSRCLPDCCYKDPCYDPHWIAIADSAFFQDAARPVTQMRLRLWDGGFGFDNPDRAEFFFARFASKPNQSPPPPPCPPMSFGKGPACIASTVDYSDFAYYIEAATGGFGLFFEIPYSHINPQTAPISSVLGTPICCSQSGFEDMNIGTKAMLVDTCIFQLTFEFKTFIPIGDFHKGLGTGHVSLEPSLPMGLRLGPDTYLQMQQAYWIPVGGDALYEGPVYHQHYSVNQLLWRPAPAWRIIGTAELNHWWVLGGYFTDPNNVIYTAPKDANGNPTGPVQATPFAVSARTNIVSAGPGFRIFYCDKIDFGVGSAFALTGSHWADELVRIEFRWRF